MPKGNLKRRELKARYGDLYKRATGFNRSICAYCGHSSECFDHVPALSVLPNIDVKEFLKKGGKLLLYPSCQQCNGILNNKNYTEYLDRLDYLSQKYYSKIERTEVWTPYEINQLSGTLKAYIQANQYKIKGLLQKIKVIEENKITHEYEDLP